jgi:hypothetical protein
MRPIRQTVDSKRGSSTRSWLKLSQLKCSCSFGSTLEQAKDGWNSVTATEATT